MQKFQQRTDLAMEARELVLSAQAGEIEGVIYEESESSGIKYQKLTVTNENGREAIGKPIGVYYTAEIASVLHRESESFTDTVTAVSTFIKEVMGELMNDGCTLVVGLGNRDITPDGIGPRCADAVLVTRHLKESAPKDFSFFKPVAVISPGVLGTSGIESSDYIKWVCENLKPERIVVVDALAARGIERLCRTVQITDSGITPGSGVGNSRNAINSQIMGVPVVAIGVPTVVDIKSIFADLGEEKLTENFDKTSEMIVTPRNIDSEVVCASRVVAYALNLALHDGLSVEDIDMLVG